MKIILIIFFLSFHPRTGLTYENCQQTNYSGLGGEAMTIDESPTLWVTADGSEGSILTEAATATGQSLDSSVGTAAVMTIIDNAKGNVEKCISSLATQPPTERYNPKDAVDKYLEKKNSLYHQMTNRQFRTKYPEIKNKLTARYNQLKYKEKVVKKGNEFAKKVIKKTGEVLLQQKDFLASIPRGEDGVGEETSTYTQTSNTEVYSNSKKAKSNFVLGAALGNEDSRLDFMGEEDMAKVKTTAIDGLTGSNEPLESAYETLASSTEASKQESLDAGMSEIRDSEDFANLRDLVGEKIANKYLESIGVGVMDNQEDSDILGGSGGGYTRGGTGGSKGKRSDRIGKLMKSMLSSLRKKEVLQHNQRFRRSLSAYDPNESLFKRVHRTLNKYFDQLSPSI